MHAYAQACASYAHPIRRSLFLPRSFNILSFDAWRATVFKDENERRNWYRLLSKRKRSVPAYYYDDIKLVLSSLLREYVRRGADESMPNITSLVYRTLSIILGMYERPQRQSGIEIILEEEAQVPPQLPNNHRWFARCIVSPRYFSLNDQLLPSIIRSLFWILKEKFSKKRTVLQVEELFMLIPYMLKDLNIELVQKFVKLVSDEARTIRDRIQEQFVAEAQTAQQQQRGQQNMAPAARADNDEDEDNQPPPAPRPPVLRAQPALTPDQARRVLEPIRMAVVICASTATLYPYCFNAPTLGTIIRNVFNLIAWGVSSAEIKYIVIQLAQRIIQNVDAEEAIKRRSGTNGSPDRVGHSPRFRRLSIFSDPSLPGAVPTPENPPSTEVHVTGAGKLTILVNHLNRKQPHFIQLILKCLVEWLPQAEWEFARETMAEVRDLFSIHLRRMEYVHYISLNDYQIVE